MCTQTFAIPLFSLRWSIFVIPSIAVFRFYSLEPLYLAIPPLSFLRHISFLRSIAIFATSIFPPSMYFFPSVHHCSLLHVTEILAKQISLFFTPFLKLFSFLFFYLPFSKSFLQIHSILQIVYVPFLRISLLITTTFLFFETDSCYFSFLPPLVDLSQILFTSELSSRYSSYLSPLKCLFCSIYLCSLLF